MARLVAADRVDVATASVRATWSLLGYSKANGPHEAELAAWLVSGVVAAERQGESGVDERARATVIDLAKYRG